MYILQATGNATGEWYRVDYGGEFEIANKTTDSLGGGSLAIQVADGESTPVALNMPADATFTAPIQSQIVKLARGTYVRAVLSGATAPVCNVFLKNTTIQGPTLTLVP